MKFSLSWLSEHIDLFPNSTIEIISNSLTNYIETMKPTEPIKPQHRYTVERQEGIAGLIDPYKVKKYI